MPLFALGGVAGVLRGVGIAKRLLAVPSEKRARSPAEQLVASANAGNVTAARAIIDRTTFGIAKERAVWQAALQRVSSDMVLAAERFKSRLPKIDHSGPEAAARSAIANARDVSTFATQTSATVEPSVPTKAKKSTTVTPPAPRQPRAAAKPRTHVRYNPDTGERVLAELGSYEDLNWSNRKPRQAAPARAGRAPRKTATEKRAGRQVTRATNAAATALAKAALGVARSVGAGGVTYAAIAGLVAYGVTREVLRSHAEGESLQNLYSLAVAKGHRDAATRLGRQVNAAELKDIRARIAVRLQAAVDAGSLPPPLGAVRSLITKLIGR